MKFKNSVSHASYYYAMLSLVLPISMAFPMTSTNQEIYRKSQYYKALGLSGPQFLSRQHLLHDYKSYLKITWCAERIREIRPQGPLVYLLVTVLLEEVSEPPHPGFATETNLSRSRGKILTLSGANRIASDLSHPSPCSVAGPDLNDAILQLLYCSIYRSKNLEGRSTKSKMTPQSWLGEHLQITCSSGCRGPHPAMDLQTPQRRYHL